MSVLRLYFDADSMQRAVIIALRARGVGATTASEAGIADQPDEKQLEFAASQGRTLFTFNASHYCALHADTLRRGASHAGIIVAPQQRYSIGERVRRLLKLVAGRSAEEMRDRLEFLSHWS